MALVKAPPSDEIPHKISQLSLDILCALVSPRDQHQSSMAGPFTRHVNVMPELGVGKGQYVPGIGGG